MKRILLLSILSISLLINAQELPTIPSNGFAFPLGSKFTIKLSAVDSVNYDYSIIAFEPFDEIVDIMENDNLFESAGKDSTLTFYFCLGTFGEAEDEKEDNLKVLLIMKNYSKLALKYTSEIQREEDGVFEVTSNVGTHPGAIGTEMWPYMIYMIGLAEFRNYD
ncbi:hypothetical protein [Geofilum rhodophaeum]|uniref:hypothetical protein n=1 Tax=Geofilum rhodophaeum TaxID=1965019 RepID=UPI0011BA8205|nr:hypothetical protein [Geofilum rhodophaeum]